MRIIKKFSDYLKIFESENSNQIELELPDEWNELKRLGFYEETPERIRKNGNMILKNSKFPYYPSGILLQPVSGYIRDKGVTSGFLKRNFDLKQMVDYLITRFKGYEEEGKKGISPEVITILKQTTKGKFEKNQSSGKFDFSGSVNMHIEKFSKLIGLGFKFGKIGGNFELHCHDLKATNTKEAVPSIIDEPILSNFPEEVRGNFEIRWAHIKGDFSNIKTKIENGLLLYHISGLKSFNGLNTKGRIKKLVIYNCKNLEDLSGLPSIVNGDFTCYENKSLRSLKGGPKHVESNFYCRENLITTLEGSPEYVGADFDCAKNFLVNLKGSPRKINGYFSCMKNNLKTLEGNPEYIWGNFRSDELTIPAGEWNTKGLLKAFSEGNIAQKKLIVTSSFISPDILNNKLRENPEKTVVELKDIWNDPNFSDIRAKLNIPSNLEKEMDLLGDLSDIGF